jgi:ABC-2 type transport system ATP-binding protein
VGVLSGSVWVVMGNVLRFGWADGRRGPAWLVTPSLAVTGRQHPTLANGIRTVLADGAATDRPRHAEDMNESTSPAIAVRGLSKSFRGQAAVEDVHFDVLAGRVVGLLGPNGAGKTTTMRMILGLAAADSGAALIHGRPYRELDRPALTLGAVLDTGGLHPGRSGRDHLRIVAAEIGVPSARIDTVLDEVDLRAAADRRVAGYSLGMRQRLALAAALLGEPSTLILDEPANGLDPAGMRWLRRLIRSFADAGGSVLLSSHVLSEVALVADDIVVIVDGRVAAAGELAATVAEHGGDLENFYLDLTATGVVGR